MYFDCMLLESLGLQPKIFFVLLIIIPTNVLPKQVRDWIILPLFAQLPSDYTGTLRALAADALTAYSRRYVYCVRSDRDRRGIG